VGSIEPNDAVFSVAVDNPPGAIYKWSATSVLKPSSMVVMQSGLGVWFVGRKVRRGRTA